MACVFSCFIVLGFSAPMERIVGPRVPYCVLREETADRSVIAARQYDAFWFADGQVVNVLCSFVFSCVQELEAVESQGFGWRT